MAGQCEDFDIEIFIGQVKNYPEIWNVAAEEYHDRVKKRSAWINICRVFNEGFEEKDDREKNEICNKLIKKWRNIRDNFMKSQKKKGKSGQAAESGRKYIYARQLAFLQQAAATTDTQSSFDDTQADLENSEDTDEVQEGAEQSRGGENSQPQHHQSTSKKRKRDVESSLLEFINAPLPTPVTVIPETNPDRSFFESLLPAVSAFTEDQKLEFRCEVLNIIKHMRQSASRVNLPPQHPHHYSQYPSSYQSPMHVPYFSSPSSSYINDYTHAHQSSPRHTEPRIRPQAHVLSPSIPSTSSSSTESPPDENTLDIFKDGQ